MTASSRAGLDVGRLDGAMVLKVEHQCTAVVIHEYEEIPCPARAVVAVGVHCPSCGRSSSRPNEWCQEHYGAFSGPGGVCRHCHSPDVVITEPIRIRAS